MTKPTMGKEGNQRVGQRKSAGVWFWTSDTGKVDSTRRLGGESVLSAGSSGMMTGIIRANSSLRDSIPDRHLGLSL